MVNREQEPSTTSSISASSVVTIISNFSENDTVPVYKYIIATFLGLLMCSMGLNLSFNLLPVLPWDNTKPTNNAITDNANMLLLAISHAKVALNLQDVAFYNYNNNRRLFNRTRLNNYYQTSFTSHISNTFNYVNQDLALTTFELFTTPS